MAENLDDDLKFPSWLVRICKWAWRKSSFLWSIVILNFVIGALVTWAFTDSTALDKTPIGLILHHPFPLLFIFLTALFLTIISGLISRLHTEQHATQHNTVTSSVTPSSLQVSFIDTHVEQHYLHRMMYQTENLTLEGIPAGLLAESVRLDEVFIPTQLRFDSPLVDYPLSESEISDWRKKLQQTETNSEMIQRVLLAAEHNWQHGLFARSCIDIADLWGRLTPDHPAAVIQGFPGIGKSTLMARLTLHMARQTLGQDDPLMPQRLEPPCIPILLTLGDYAREREKKPGLSIANFLTIAINRLKIEGIDTYVSTCLKVGRCLLLLDGLDEVSNSKERKEIQAAIRLFVLENRPSKQQDKSTIFNRFLITSRVAGFDKMAFPDYEHYVIAELTEEQIKIFLPNWFRASVRSQRWITSQETEGNLAQDAQQRADQLIATIKHNQGVRTLVENPLLLTLLAIMQQNSIELPRQRVELYSVVTKTLLENRNLDKNLPSIPEEQAILRLGPLAYEMHATQNSLALEQDVLQALTGAIQEEGGTSNEVEQEAHAFLERVRIRGGLFVQRASDYFGFFHRTFQEYFAARYILNQINHAPEAWIHHVVNLVTENYTLWREPFLLAVAYQSRKDGKVATSILYTLLNAAPSGEQNVLFAAECVIESKFLTLDSTLERKIVLQLLQIYGQEYQRKNSNQCGAIEDIIRRWLLSLPKEAYRPPVLVELLHIITDSRNPTLLVAVLTMLTIIIQQIDICPAFVFDTLVPPLLALADLPSVGKYKPNASLASSTNFDVIDLALTALSSMGRRGPAGELLHEIKAYLKEHPYQLHLLARYSLECGTLITPTVTPLQPANYQQYATAIDEWVRLRDAQGVSGRVTEQDIDACLSVHERLLDSAEEALFPTAQHISHMLKLPVQNSTSWQQLWQQYLLTQMCSDRYIIYQESILLWIVLFENEAEQRPVANVIQTDYDKDGSLAQRYAQRFLAILSNSLRDSRDDRDLRTVRDMRTVRDLRYLIFLQQPEAVKLLRDPGDMAHLRILRTFINLRRPLLTANNINKAIMLLSAADEFQTVDLLAILMGRLLQILNERKLGEPIEREVQQIAETIMKYAISYDAFEAHQTALDGLRYLPARNVNEEQLVLRLIKRTTDPIVRQACIYALEQGQGKRDAEQLLRQEGI